jgi:iron complex transport system substrate-binding protein
VGVTDFCHFPPEVKWKEKVGGWINPNIEKIVSLKPDLVLSVKFYGRNEETLRNLGIPVLVLDYVTMKDILNSYDILGKRLGLVSRAQEARKRLEDRLNRIRSMDGGQKPISVLFVIGHDPGQIRQIYAVGSHDYINDLITWVGGKNIISDSKIPYPLASKEEILRRDPDVIFDALPKSEVKEEDFLREKEAWNQLPTLKAVRRGQVYCFNNEDFTIPGPTMVHLGEYLSKTFQKVRESEKIK